MRGRIYLVLLASILLFSNFVFAGNYIALQGNVKQGGVDLSSGDLIITIYDAATGGNMVYNSTTDFDNAISNGEYDIMIGSGSNELNLDYGTKYYLEMYVNGESFSFGGDARQVFESSVGNITYQNIDANIPASYINKSTGTNWVGTHVDSILDTIYDWVTAVNTTDNIAGLGFAKSLGGNNINGTQNFDGGWLNGGITLSAGDIFAQTIYVYNLSSLAINSLSVNGSLIPRTGFDNFFDIGSASLRWRHLYLSGNANITGNLTLGGNGDIFTNATSLFYYNGSNYYDLTQGTSGAAGIWDNVSGTATYNGNVTIGGNLQLNGNLSLNGTITGQNTSYVRAKKTSNQEIVSATSTTIDYETEDYDTLGEWNGTAFTATETGYYKINAHLLYNTTAWTAGQIASLELYKNGILISVLDRNTIQGTFGQFVNIGGSDTIYLTSGDFIQIHTYHNRGSNTNIYISDDYHNYVSIERIHSPITIGSTTSGAAGIWDNVSGTATYNGNVQINGNLSLNGTITNQNTTYVRAKQSSAQVVANSAWVTIVYDTEDYDTLNEYNSSGAFNPTESGYYQVSASILTANAAWAAGELHHLAIYKNGGASPLAVLDRGVVDAALTAYKESHGVTTIYLEAGDYIEIKAYFLRGGATTTLHNDASYNYVSIERIHSPITIGNGTSGGGAAGIWSNVSGTATYFGNVNISGSLFVDGSIETLNGTKIRAKDSSAQSIADNTFQTINYATEDYDVLGEWNGTAFTASETGYYKVSASFLTTIVGWTVNDITQVAMFKNGVRYSDLSRVESETSATLYNQVSGSDTIYLTSGDFIQIKAFIKRGAATNLHTETSYNYVAIERINAGMIIQSTNGGTPYEIAAFYQTTCPQGWSLADGSNGTPDLRGVFIRGAGVNGNITANATYGTYQNDQMQGHIHNMKFGNGAESSSLEFGSGGTPGAAQNRIGSTDATGNTISVASPLTDGTNGTARYGEETRPDNFALIYCMKNPDDSMESTSVWEIIGDVVRFVNTSKILHIGTNVNISGNISMSYGDIISNATSLFYYNGSKYYNLAQSSGGTPNEISPFYQTTCPTGWILADGTLGTPDLRGVFIRGAGVNGNITANATYGTYQNDQIQGHKHNAFATIYGQGGEGAFALTGSTGIDVGIQSPSSDGTNGTVRYGEETRPDNFALIYCMKTEEDTAESNSIWQTVGNLITLVNTSKILHIGTDVNVTGKLDAHGNSKVRAKDSSGQSIPNAAITTIVYATEDYDTLGEWNGTAFTATETGYYHVTAGILTSEVAWTAGNVPTLYLYKNNALYSVIDRHQVEASTTKYRSLTGSDTIYLAVNDYIDIRFYHNRGSATTLISSTDFNYVSIMRIP